MPQAPGCKIDNECPDGYNCDSSKICTKWVTEKEAQQKTKDGDYMYRMWTRGKRFQMSSLQAGFETVVYFYWIKQDNLLAQLREPNLI